MSQQDPPASGLGAIRANLEVFLDQLATWREMETGWIRALLAAYDAQAARLADAQTAGDTDPALYHDMASLRRRAPFAYGQWRADLAFLLETVDAQAARLAAVEQLMQEADITCSCCQSWVETLQAAIHAGAVGAGEESDGA